ncbi:hypothetical protein KA013_04390 [Patescibacteria group bacterium]|nr:hypothetical protein [Patescibacteria group bacterium]
MLKKIVLFLLRNIGLVGKGVKVSVQAILIQFIVQLLLQIITKYLKKKGIDLDTLQDKIVAEVMKNLERENLEKSWATVKNKGTVIKESLIATIKKYVRISNQEVAEINELTKAQTDELDELLRKADTQNNSDETGEQP